MATGFERCQHNTQTVSVKSEKVSEYVYVQGQRFKDLFGRDLILNGINIVNKDPGSGYTGHITPEAITQLKSWGFNTIRLGLIWDGLEPVPGKYNEEYLVKIDEMIQWATQNNLYIVLDMHQDLFSVKYSDGAPVWATIDEGKPHITGDIWSDSYLMSPAVQTSFDNFWENANAPDGIGIQDHYIAAWKYVAERYADNTTVVGFDIMNEPFMGSQANNIMPVLLNAYAQVVAESTGMAPSSAEELVEIWSNEDSRLEALKNIAKADKYMRVIDAIYDINAAFENTVLSDFYQKTGNEIRKVDKNHILFLEHGYFNNIGVSSAIQPVMDENGNPDPLQAYAAHGYDLLTDTKEVESPSYERMEFIFSRIAENSVRLNMPVFLGEWGAYHSDSQKMVETACQTIDLIEEFKFSNTFWAYYKDIEQYPFFSQCIIRPYPIQVCGDLTSYHYNMITGEFGCAWAENPQISEPTIIFIPNLKGLIDENIHIEPGPDEIILESIPSSKAGYLFISPAGMDQVRQLKIKILR